MEQEIPPRGHSMRVRVSLIATGCSLRADGVVAFLGGKSGTKDSIYTIYDLTKGGVVTDERGRRMFQASEAPLEHLRTKHC